jgi:alkanesulfonate monooxygenase SsuD/methylene tetrahydromethanopterin reductase-like flavin-dependent oxidoreductase (luciferase family)
VSEATQRAGIESQVQRAAGAASARNQDKFQTLARQMDEIIERGYVIVGSPDEVAEQLRDVAVNLNVGHLMLLLQFGNMSKELTRYNTRLFAQRVMPQMKGMFAEWEDRWWPQSMAAAARARPAPFGVYATAAE